MLRILHYKKGYASAPVLQIETLELSAGVYWLKVENGSGKTTLFKIAYSVNLVVSLFLLTAIQYSKAQSRDEYLKATFAIFFVSIFFLHVQAFWFWIALQIVAVSILFVSGYYAYEEKAEHE